MVFCSVLSKSGHRRSTPASPTSTTCVLTAPLALHRVCDGVCTHVVPVGRAMVAHGAAANAINMQALSSCAIWSQLLHTPPMSVQQGSTFCYGLHVAATQPQSTLCVTDFDHHAVPVQQKYTRETQKLLWQQLNCCVTDQSTEGTATYTKT